MRDAAFLIYVHIGQQQHRGGEYNHSSEGYMKLRLKWKEGIKKGERKEKVGLRKDKERSIFQARCGLEVYVLLKLWRKFM